MSKFLNKIFALTLGLLLLTSQNALAKSVEMDLNMDGKVTHYVSEEVFIKVDGKTVITKEMPPIIINDRTLVPAREMFETMGANVTWVQETKEVNVTFSKSHVNLKINSPLAKVSVTDDSGITTEKDITMDVVAKIINDKTMIPFRAVSEALGYEVEWVQSSRTILITSPKGNEIARDVYVTSIDDEVPSSLLVNSLEWSCDAKNVINKTVIEDEKNETCNVLSASINLLNSDYAEVTIKTDGSITGIETSELDNRIVLDIKNSKRIIDETTNFKDNSFVTKVRSNQFNDTTVRCVLDLKSLSAPYMVRTNNARTKIIVRVYKNEITKVTYNESKNEGTFIIKANSKIDGNFFRVTKNKESEKIYIEIENASCNFDTDEETLSNTNLVDCIRLIEDKNKVRFELDTKIQVFFEEEKINDNTIKLTISKPDYDEDIVYHFEKDEKNDEVKSYITFPSDLVNNVQVSDIDIVEDYMNGIYEIRFNKKYSQLGEGLLNTSDERINSFEIKTVNGKSTIKFIPKDHLILAFDVKKERKNFTINIMLPGEKYDEVLILDAGHGNGNEGTTDKYYKGYSSDPVNIIKEDDLTIDIVTKANKILEEDSNIKVYLTRESNEKFNDLIKNYTGTSKYINGRVKMENSIKADAFISIHINNMDLTNGEKTTPWQGTEVLYNSDVNTDGKGYDGLSNLNLATELIDGFIDKTKGNYKNKAGEYTQKNSKGEMEDIKHVIDSYTYRVGVIRLSEIPSALLEIGFLNNEIDHENLLSKDYRDLCAKAIAETIIEIFDDYDLNRN